MTPRKRILLGVTGGIAAYKSPDLVRRLIERGADVQVVMTAAAQQFVSALTFQAVSGRPTRSDLWDRAAEAAMGHIELARWAEMVLVAPASADFIARLAGGRADDLLATLCLATEAPLVLAPAMNRVMWSNKATQTNVQTLVGRGVRILGPGSGEQACGEIGLGRMWEPAKLAESLLEPAPNAGLLAGLSVLITAGPTRERLDPVRYLTNRSSGKMGFAVAAAAREAGAHVTLVSGPVQLPTPTGVTRLDVESARDMYAAVHRHVAEADIFIAAAAVADFQPVTVAKQKIKKQGTSVKLDLEAAPDFIRGIVAAEGEAQAGAGALRGETHRAQYMGWVHGSGRARGAGGAAHTGLVQKQEYGLGVDALEGDARRIWQSALAIPVDLGVRDGVEDLLFKGIAQPADGFVFVGELTACQFSRRAEPDAVRHVFRAGALAMLLAATHEVGVESGPAVHVQDADPLGAMQLVPGDGEEIDMRMGVGQVDRHFSHGLHRVSVKEHPLPVDDGRDLLDGEHSPGLVVGPHGRDDGCIRADGALQLLQVHLPFIVHAQPGDFHAPLGQPLALLHDGAVLDTGGHDMLPVRVQRER